MVKGYDWKDDETDGGGEPSEKIKRIEIEFAENGCEVMVTCEPRPMKQSKSSKGRDVPTCAPGLDYDSCHKKYVFSNKAQAVKFLAEKLS